jgi:hypothetical protein
MNFHPLTFPEKNQIIPKTEVHKMAYNYNDAIRDDVREYINDNVDFSEWIDNRDGLEEQLNDDLWTVDSVTGNGSGSYWFNSWKAEEALMHNLDLLAEAVDEFGGCTDVLRDGAEACDVTIRCYLLPGAISDVLDELEEEGTFTAPDSEEEDATETA